MRTRSKAVLEWILKYGEQAEFLESLAEENPDRPIPAALEIRPELPKHLERVVDAFLMLSRSRPIAAGFAGIIYQPIPPSEALAVAKAIHWPGFDFLRVIGPADQLYVASLNERTN